MEENSAENRKDLEESRETEEIKTVLESINMAHLIDKFVAEKIYVSTVPLLSSAQFKELGVQTMGEQAILQEACKQAYGYNKIAREVKRIMQPAGQNRSLCCTTSAGATGSSYSNTLKIERRQKMVKKRKGGPPISKNEPAVKKTIHFQKKLVVFKFMRDSPRSFGRKDSNIQLRGLLPEIFVDATEGEIREDISVLRNSEEFDFSTHTCSDFEFIDVNGKQASVPLCRDGQEFNGRSIKQMAGAGAVYVRLTKCLPFRNVEIQISDDSDFDLSPHKGKEPEVESDSSIELPFSNLRGTKVTNDDIAISSDSQASSNASPLLQSNSTVSGSVSSSLGSSGNSATSSSSLGFSSTAGSSSSGSTDGSSSSSNVQASYSSMRFSTTTSISHSVSIYERLGIPGPEDMTPDENTYNSHPRSMPELQQQFPAYSIEQLSIIFEISGCNFSRTFDVLNNCTLDNVLQLVHDRFITLATEESPKITIREDSSPEELTEMLIAFYKGSRFMKNGQVRVVVVDKNVMDGGGVRRQLFSTSFESLALGHLMVFEGPKNRLRPTVKPSNVVSGLIKNVGKAVSHSLIMDKTGFPYLSPPIYNYLVGREDIAITLLENIDVSGQAAHAVLKLDSSSSEKLVEDDDDLRYIEAILNETGSELCLEVSKKDEILQTIIIHNGLHKRKVFLDSFSEGLEEYRLYSLMKLFPDLFEPVFTGREVCSDDVINNILPIGSYADNNKKKTLISTLFDYLRGLSSKDLRRFLFLVTGSISLSSECILLDFTSDAAISFITCTRRIILSTEVDRAEGLKEELDVLIHDKKQSFTMA